MRVTKYSTRRDVESYIEQSIGEGWPTGTVAAVADEIILRAHDCGMIYGQDWSEIIDDVLPDDAWQESIEGIIRTAGIAS